MIVSGGLLFQADEVVADWVDAMCGGGKVGGPYAAIGALDAENRLMAGAVFHTFHPGCDLTVTMATVRPSLRLRSVFRAGLSYAFEQLGVPRITAEIEMSNTRSIRLVEGLGFVREGVKRRAAPGGKHVGVFGLLRKDMKL